MEPLSSVGYAVHGAIYIFIGLVAAGLPWRVRGELEDSPKAIKILDALPNARVLVSFIAAGLVPYAVALCAGHRRFGLSGRTLKRLIARIGRGVSGVGYGAPAPFASLCIP
jgi:hypothetical protein